MEFSNGYTATFYAAVVDPGTWQDIDRLEIVSGSISRNENDIRQSADLTLRDYDGKLDRWIRIYMDRSKERPSYMCPSSRGWRHHRSRASRRA